MAYLYINSHGVPWRKHSYSAGNDFDHCPYKYYLRRVLGWKERDNKARFLFGKALEESIQYYHDHDGVGAVEDFKRRWEEHKQTPNLAYTDTEKNWETCLKMGTDMIRLYIAMQPSLPIPIGGRAVFQREYIKEVFPGDPNYGEIEDAGKLDIVCYADWDHPMLPKRERPTPARKRGFDPARLLIVDIKTSDQDFPEQPGMAAFDAQLRRYSWISGIRDVALLWFKKTGLGYKRGYTVTFLEAAGQYKPGDMATIARVEGEDLWVVYNDFMLTEMDRAQGKRGTKLDKSDEAEQRVVDFLKQHGLRVHSSFVTKQRLQFNAGIVSEKSAEDAGRQAAQQIIGIVNATKSKDWPNTFGIRYPKDDCNDSYFRAFVYGDEKYRNANFVRSDQKSFDELFQED